MSNISLILLPLFGFLIGLLVNTLGGGGSSLYVPILTVFLGITPQVEVTRLLVTVLPTTAVGTVDHYRMGNVDIHTSIILGISGILGTLIGAYVANSIPPTF